MMKKRGKPMVIGRLLVFLGLTLAITGCMTFEVGSNASITEESVNNYETVHGSFYGFRWRDYKVQKCHDGALAMVEFHYNWFELLASAVTLGLYVPQTVEWWCDDSSSEDDTNEPGLSPDDE